MEPANCLICGSGREFRIKAFEQGQVVLSLGFVLCFLLLPHSRGRAPRWQYIGEFLEGFRHGMGRFEYSNGNLFTGAWEKDMKLGFGTLKWANGDEYTGEWKENKMCLLFNDPILQQNHDLTPRPLRRWGYGQYRHANGNSYTGRFVADNKHGHGPQPYLCLPPIAGVLRAAVAVASAMPCWRGVNFNSYFTGTRC